MSANFGGSAPGGLANGGTHGRGPSIRGINRIDIGIGMEEPCCGAFGNYDFVIRNERRMLREDARKNKKKK